MNAKFKTQNAKLIPHSSSLDMAGRSNNFWNQGVQLIQVCPLCETSYNPMEARIVGERDDSHLVYIQ